ncbi:DUF4124 domain-containing protein [Methylomonas sp. LW13]|uniref:DUF4124 domain-containing protein n=1 Tax=unclassified Methylomonas TaxID=2608980 RepID=UPI00051AEC17|nr:MULTISPECIES: DUF4124 domain-containing protein [unclassified Methylomonas]PKD42235.1 DUF4124 domain-containing protein [Methylomonas sp. Kb3]QBC25738.1 DUF4124 domain-containing protein [Methylomonas sp. LW13]
MKNLFFVFALCLSADSWAGVFKCTDASGHTNYQSSPCTVEHKAVQMNTKTGSSVDLNALERQQAAEAELKKQQSAQEQAEHQAKLDAIAKNKQDARVQSEMTQTLIKQNPMQFSAFAIPPYDPEKLPAQVKPFETRLPDVEKFRRLAAQKALASGECQRIETDELTGKSKPDQLNFLINCSSGKTFLFNEADLVQP